MNPMFRGVLVGRFFGRCGRRRPGRSSRTAPSRRSSATGNCCQDGNPAELWEARGESLWKEQRGPKHASLERCDIGLGPGVVKGA